MLALAKFSKYCPVQLSPLSLFSSLIPMFFLFSSTPLAYCLPPKSTAYTQDHSLLFRPTVYSPSLLHTLQAYFILSKPTAYSPSLLPTLQAYCILSKPTAYSQSLLHTLKAYCLLPRFTAYFPGLLLTLLSYCQL
jgi:hypothetical protein